MERAVIIIRSNPQKYPRAVEGIRLAAAMIGMDFPLVLVFIDDGVSCLRPGYLDESGSDYIRTIADLAGIRVLSESLNEHGLDTEDLDATLRVIPTNTIQLAKLIGDGDLVATF